MSDNNDDFMDDLLDNDNDLNVDADTDFEFSGDEDFNTEDTIPDTTQEFDEDSGDPLDHYSDDLGAEDAHDDGYDDGGIIDDEDEPNSSQTPPTKNKMIPIIIGVVSVLAIGVGGGLYYALSGASPQPAAQVPPIKSSAPAGAGESFGASKGIIDTSTIVVPEDNMVKPIVKNIGAGDSFGLASPSVNEFNSDVINEGADKASKSLDNAIALEVSPSASDAKKIVDSELRSYVDVSIEDVKSSIASIDSTLTLKIASIDQKVDALNGKTEKISQQIEAMNKKMKKPASKSVKKITKESTKPMVMAIKDNRLLYDTKYIVDGTVWLQKKGSNHITKYTVGDTLSGYGLIRSISSKRGVFTVHGYINSAKVSGQNIAAKNKPVITLIGAINGKAWVKSPKNKKVYAVVAGDKIRGYGAITSISANGVIQSETGLVKTVLR